MDNIEKLRNWIKESNNIVFFGGAGVSTESGMKDYRSEDGLYNTVKKYKVSPETILSHSFFETRPDVFYDFYYNCLRAGKGASVTFVVERAGAKIETSAVVLP